MKFKNVQYFLFILLGITIGGTISVIASNAINANQVGFSSSKTSKINLQDALDKLYINANKPERNTSIYKLEGVKAVIYLDPTDLSKKCNANNSTSDTNQKTGCMKWYAYAETDTTYTMILDHNSTERVYYNYDNVNTSMGMRSASELSTVAGTTITYNEIGYELQQLTSTSNWVVTPRLITWEDISSITGNISITPSDNNGSGFHFDNNSLTQVATKKGESRYSWLYDYTVYCTLKGCNVDRVNWGYWTSTAYTKDSIHVCRISDYGNIACNHSSTTAKSSETGLRPVITVSKSLIEI